jgi:histidine triad (HIT) family protein
MTTKDTTTNCIFCKIIRGDLPSYNIYADETCVAFLDLFPATAGHTLLVPRAHHELMDTMPPDQVAAVFNRIPELGKAVKAAVGADAYNLLVNNGREAGQVVPHVHIHIIPRKAGDGLIRHPGGGPRLDPETAEPLVRALKQQLGCDSTD